MEKVRDRGCSLRKSNYILSRWHGTHLNLCNDKLNQVQDKMTKIINEQGELDPFQIQGEDIAWG